MPLPRIWKALRWTAAHPSADSLVRAYFGIREPSVGEPAKGSLEDLAAYGRETGLGG